MPGQSGSAAYAPPTVLHPTGTPDAEAFFHALCWEGGEPFCPRCREEKTYALKDGRTRCSGCGYTFHDFTGRWLNQCSLSAAEWYEILFLFCQGRHARAIADTVDRTYNTVHKALTVIRVAIAAGEEDADALLDTNGKPRTACPATLPSPEEMTASGHCPDCRSLVFGVTQTNGSVSVRAQPDLKGQEVLGYPLAKTLSGILVVTDRHGPWDALMFSCCKLVRATYRRQFHAESVHLERCGGFLPFARRRLEQYRCVTPSTYPLYLKELAFRYNHRAEALLPRLAGLLCAFVPDFGH